MSFKPISTPPAPEITTAPKSTPWDPEVLKELIKLLSDSSPSVRGGALVQVAALSASIEGRAALSGTEIVRVLVRLIGDVNLSYVKDAMTCLINLAEVRPLAQQMVERNVVSRVLDLLLESASSASKLLPLYTMLLSNVTRIETGARKLVNLDDDASMKGYYLSKLLPIFLGNSQKEDEDNTEKTSTGAATTDKTSWIGSILVNATTVSEGRKIFTDKENRLLKLLIPQISSKSVIRRRSALGIIRNCMFDSVDHEWVLKDEEMDLIVELVLPIRGNQIFEENKDLEGMPTRLSVVPGSKTIDSDLECRKLIVDTLTLFTATKFGRDFLKQKNIYPIVRELDRVEENEYLSEKIYELVHVLVLEDPEDEEGQQKAAKGAQGAQLHSTMSPAPEPTPPPTQPDTDEYGEVIEEL